MQLGQHGIREFILALEECINGARDAKRILVMSPYYTHSEGNKMLIELALKGVEINVLVQKEAWKKGYPIMDQALLFKLNSAGPNVIIKTLDNLHAKIFCIRHKDLRVDIWDGSANFTKKADGSIKRPGNPANIEFIQRSVIRPSLTNEISKIWVDGTII